MEKQYLKAIIEALKPKGSVLEVGFHPEAALLIQSYQPKAHVIIERNRDKAKDAKAFAAKHPSITVIEGPWESALKPLKTFDAIFFGECPLGQIRQALEQCSPTQMQAASKEVKSLLDQVTTRFHNITLRFSDDQIDSFCKTKAKEAPDVLATFLKNLKTNGNITDKQYQTFINKYHLNNSGEADPLLLFLEACLKSHMAKGSRFSAYLNDNCSKQDNPAFFERIATNPNLHYQEKLITLDPKSPQALLMVIEKVG